MSLEQANREPDRDGDQPPVRRPLYGARPGPYSATPGGRGSSLERPHGDAGDEPTEGSTDAGRVEASRVDAGRVEASSGRGPSWLAVTILELLIAGIGSAVDVVVSGRPGWGFEVGLVLAGIAGAVLVRPRDRYSAVVIPPIVAAICLLGCELYRHGWSGLARTLLVVASELALLAPAVYLATVLALVIVLVRRVRGRRRSRVA